MYQVFLVLKVNDNKTVKWFRIIYLTMTVLLFYDPHTEKQRFYSVLQNKCFCKTLCLGAFTLSKTTSHDSSSPSSCSRSLSRDSLFYHIKTKGSDDNTPCNRGAFQTQFSSDAGNYRPRWKWLIYIESQVIFRALVAWVTGDTTLANMPLWSLPRWGWRNESGGG